MPAFWGSKGARLAPWARTVDFTPQMLAPLPAERLCVDPIERQLYARDLAPVPDILNRLFYRTLPEAVVLPENAAQTAETLRQAYRCRIPVTPRASATTSYSNAVAVRGGLVLDVSRLNAAPELDAARGTVRVGPAVTWMALDESLAGHGFAVRSYPSSAVAATVGGWVSTQGHGLGSLKYGPLVGQLVSLEVILPGGEIRTVTRDSQPPLEWFAAAEGTLGVITAVEIEVRRRPPAEELRLLAYDDLEALGREAAGLARGDPTPYTVFFADAGYFDLAARSGFAALPGGQGALLVCYQGEAEEVNRGQKQAAACSGRRLPADLALEEWNARLYHLRIKRAGPSLLAAELWLPLDQLAAYLAGVSALARRSRVLIGTYGLVVSLHEALVMSLYPCDESHQVDYLMALGFTRRLQMLGARLGGRPYGVGLWNTPYLPQLFSRAQLQELRRRKAQLDPLDLLNPGKLYRAEFPLWPAAFGLGAEALAAGYTAFGRKYP